MLSRFFFAKLEERIAPSVGVPASLLAKVQRVNVDHGAARKREEEALAKSHERSSYREER